MRRYAPATGCWFQVMIVNREDWRPFIEDQDGVFHDRVLHIAQSNLQQSNMEQSNMVDALMADFGEEEMDTDKPTTEMTDEVMNDRDEVMGD